MKFIADVMLGRLAKRMRLLGYDVLYDRKLDDNELIRISLSQNRTILTRDVALAHRPLAANHIWIASDDTTEQIEQVLAAFPSEEPPRPLTRCSACNGLLEAASRAHVKDLVPQYVYEKYDDFLCCTVCDRVYWWGTHVEKMNLKGKVKKRQRLRQQVPKR